MISAVIPFGFARPRRLLGGVDRLRPLLCFVLGWAVVMAPWLVKNVIDTGNPVYPLASNGVK